MDNTNKRVTNVDDDFDPYADRQLEYGTTNFETLVHVLKCSIGIGILATPEAFKHAGLFMALGCTIIFGITMTYCLHLLIRAHYFVCKMEKVQTVSYREIMKSVLTQGPKNLRKCATAFAILVDVFFILFQIGVCIVYIIFVPANLKLVVEFYTKKEINLRLYELMCGVPFLLMSLIPNLKVLAPFSTLANIMSFACFGTIYYYLLNEMKDFDKLVKVGHLHTFPLFIGTTFTAVQPIGVLITLINTMKTPRKLGGACGLLNISMTIVFAIFAFMGFFGYYRYGAAVKSSITLNLPQEIIPHIITVGFAMAILLSFGLQAYVPVALLWENYALERLEGRKCLLGWQYLIRFGFFFISFGLAVAVPKLGPVISFIGAFCLSCLSVLFPCFLDICIHWPDHLGRFRWILVKDIILIIFGFCGLLSGSYSSLRDIIIEE